jgi:hypothetical protein
MPSKKTLLEVDLIETGYVTVVAEGKWSQTTLYECPVLQLRIKEYFRFTKTYWSYENQERRAFDKGCFVIENGIKFADFGSCHRRSLFRQQLIPKVCEERKIPVLQRKVFWEPATYI